MKYLSLLLVLLCSCSRPNCDLSASLDNVPATVKVGDELIFGITVTNLGPDVMPSHSYKMSLMVDGKITGFDNAGNERPSKVGDLVKYSKEKPGSDFVAKKVGEIDYTLKVEPKFNIKDINVKNNVVTGKFIVTE